MKKLRSLPGRVAVRLAAPIGAVVRYATSAGPGLAGVGLASYGAWLAWEPAGYLTAGFLILADRAYTHVKGGRE